MRKLATVQRVHTVAPIEGADFVVRLGILGWTLVSQKGNFNPNDLCVYFEVDSVLPNIEEFKFLLDGLSPDNLTDAGRVSKALRLKPKKLRKVISQGLALPLSALSRLLPSNVAEGDDVTQLLGVTKYEPPEESTSLEAEGKFPFQIPKTDETRIQAVPELLNELRGITCYSTIKLDGQSLTFARILNTDGTVSNKVCTRNLALRDIEGNHHWEMAKKLDIFSKLPVNFAIQGEFVGPRIQKNRLALKQNEFFAFQIFDITNQKYLSFNKFKQKCLEWSVPMVPIEQESFTLDHTVEQLLEMSEGKYGSGFPREGLVIRPVEERASVILQNYGGACNGRASFKVINPHFLLKIEN